MKISHVMVVMSTLVPALAWSAPVHNVWSTSAAGVTAPGVSGAPGTTTGSVSWTESSTFATANVRVKTAAGDLYEFQLASVTSPTSADEVIGLWNVSRNGVALCTNCAGHAYGLKSATPGSYFKIYVDTERYGVGPIVSSRYDF